MVKERRTAVRRDVFVAEYKSAIQNGQTNAELAAKLGMPVEQVSMRASLLRKRLKADYNVDLPKLKRADRTVSTADLADLAEFCKPAETEAE